MFFYDMIVKLWLSGINFFIDWYGRWVKLFKSRDKNIKLIDFEEGEKIR